MEKLVELSDHEIRVDFSLGCKCRTNIRLKSLNPTSPVAFKIQTSSPHKFLVNPPSGLVPPLSSTTFQIVLKPQSHLPATYPRSPSDRFLLKTAAAPDLTADLPEETRSDLVNRWFNSNPNRSTYDVKLKVYFVGPFLLSHAVGQGNFEAVKGIIKRHVAAGFDRTEEVERVIGGVEGRDREGRTALHLAVSKGRLGPAKVLVGAGANVDARSKDGRTAMYRAAANGDRWMVEMLLEAGADPTIGDVEHCRSAIDVARDKGHTDIVKILERGEAVLQAARRGEVEQLESLLEKGATTSFHDQYGLTPLHVAAIKGNKDVVMILVEFGADVECRDVEGHTPLHLAVEGGSIETVEVLINRGANTNAKTERGGTPLYISRLMEYEDITQLLLDKGAVS